MLALSLLVGCSGSHSDTKGTTPAEACNTLVDDGRTVSVGPLTTAAPTLQGGTLVDGTYELTGAVLYGAAVDEQVNTTASAIFTFEGDVIQQVGHVDGVLSRYTSTFTTSGNMISTTDTCPSPDSGTYMFAATPVEFRVYIPATRGRTLEQIFTKR